MAPRDLAPTAFIAWDELAGVVAATTPPELLALAHAVVGGSLGSGAEPTGRTSAVAFGEQVVVDVASLTDDVRAAGLAELGGASVSFVLAVWVEDMTVRAERAFVEMFGSSAFGSSATANGDNAWAAQERFLGAVAKLDALDPVTTELVRLRGARAHNCRLCQSRRNVTAIDLTGTADLFEVEDPTGLTPAQDVALKVVDTFVWTPLHWPEGLGASVVTSLGEAGAVELVLDIVRNAANKIAVAFAADAPHVESGVEYFAIDPDTGDLRYDVAPA